MTIEVCFYIHGVSQDQVGASHRGTYRVLHEGIQAQLPSGSVWPTEFDGAEWGWNYDGGLAESHKALVDAQRVFGGQVMDDISAQRDLTVNPLRWVLGGMRGLMFHGFGDMFYYVSKDGKWAVRYAVATQLAEHVQHRRGDSGFKPSTAADNERAISLTLLGHSAGAVVAFDFAYYLFNDRKEMFSNAGTESAGTQFVNDKRLEEARTGLDYLRTLVKSGQMRIRRLVTFGAPISMVMFRNDALVELLARGETIDPADYGLESSLKGESLDGPRWINIWDKDDPIAWPVEPAVRSPLVKDLHVDVSDSIANAHNKYWASRKCQNVIAEHW